MKKWWYLISLLLLFSCKNQKISSPEPVMEMENYTDVIIEDGIPQIDSGSVGQEGNIEFEVKHPAMDQEKIDSIKALKNKQKKLK
ncbi:MAG TPA: hypothetical protein P5050_05805 [Bacteroidia bacterium]|nr:hypothetical protein [Sphingobacteriales bacterium]HPD65120.1 hypothetical protein [Bacteroidia bacterium]HRS58719.1 hypothetical protein [Bacteroidia bacterium]HRU68358.1 hypothetical protein [Bacteroidia bacterium]